MCLFILKTDPSHKTVGSNNVRTHTHSKKVTDEPPSPRADSPVFRSPLRHNPPAHVKSIGGGGGMYMHKPGRLQGILPPNAEPVR